ncbi:MAG: ribonuclease Y [Patescibacteria group bacterium]
MVQQPLLAVGILIVGVIAGYLVRRFLAAKQASSIEERVRRDLDRAKDEAKSVIATAEQKATGIVDASKREVREREQQLARTEERIAKKEEGVESQARDLDRRERELRDELNKVSTERNEIRELERRATQELERLAGFSAESAKQELMGRIEREYRDDMVKTVQRLEQERREDIEKRSLDIITTALNRYARSHVSELTTTLFTLPNEELKGKIIGREGRNIRTLERLTGVEVIMDETPDSIIFSSFDPLRREIAKVAMEKLVKDGRIQPAKIEEKVEEAKTELTKRMVAIGEQAALEVGVLDLPKEIIQLLGRLHFRTSYGQNVLVHSVEMAHISAMMAAELGADVAVARKGALLHDIGKAISHEVEGTHVELGRKILKKYGVDDRVVKAMEAHHEEYPFSTPESFIVAAADVLSAARPGARRDTVENYLKRLEDLEKVVHSFEGVKNVYALSAGREVRVFVVPEKVDDFGALQMAKNIAAKIQTELKYPGEIKVNVIREMRAVEYAR